MVDHGSGMASTSRAGVYRYFWQERGVQRKAVHVGLGGIVSVRVKRIARISEPVNVKRIARISEPVNRYVGCRV